MPILVGFGTFAADRGAARWDELPAHVDAFVANWVRTHGGHAARPPAGRSGLDLRNAVEQMLSVALPDRAAVTSPACARPFARQAPGFFAYLRDERGLREASIRHYGHFLRDFEGYLGRIGCRDLEELSPLLLSAFVTESAGHLGRSAMIGLCSALRIFLSYLRRGGIVARDLARGIEPPGVYRSGRIARSIAWDEVRRMLEAVDRRAPVGRRDYAILLLLVTYGLRAREVANLTLDDIDWRRERSSARTQSRSRGNLPAITLVGEAILEYLNRAARKPTTATCSSGTRAASTVEPRGGVEPSQPLSSQGRRAGAPRRLAYLRHACVQRLVDASFPLKTIGDYVGHRSASSTRSIPRWRSRPFGTSPWRRGGAAMRPVNAELGSPLAGAIRASSPQAALNRRYDTEEQALRLLDRYLVERAYRSLPA